jgi:hypothetical protein
MDRPGEVDIANILLLMFSNRLDSALKSTGSGCMDYLKSGACNNASAARGATKNPTRRRGESSMATLARMGRERSFESFFALLRDPEIQKQVLPEDVGMTAWINQVADLARAMATKRYSHSNVISFMKRTFRKHILTTMIPSKDGDQYPTLVRWTHAEYDRVIPATTPHPHGQALFSLASPMVRDNGTPVHDMNVIKSELASHTFNNEWFTRRGGVTLRKPHMEREFNKRLAVLRFPKLEDVLVPDVPIETEMEEALQTWKSNDATAVGTSVTLDAWKTAVGAATTPAADDAGRGHAGGASDGSGAASRGILARTLSFLGDILSHDPFDDDDDDDDMGRR